MKLLKYYHKQAWKHMYQSKYKVIIHSIKHQAYLLSDRPNWIKLYGQEYHLSKFVHTGFQLDDLPSFGQIKNILIVATPLLYVKMYTTFGINNHLACFAIQCAYTYSLIPISKLASMESYGAHHSIGDDNIYIVMRSHVVNKI